MMGAAGPSRIQPRANVLLPQILSKIGQHKDERKNEGTKSTSQNADKRTEAFPVDLHRAILN